MKLVKFSVTNFRSILKAHDIPISDTTVLVGKNNEGKSNLLKALSIAMNTIGYHAMETRRKERRPSNMMRHRPPRRYAENFYEWKRDFPISQRHRKGKKQTTFKLEFELTEDEVSAFRNGIKSNLNGTLPLKITIGDNDEAEIKVVKGGRGNKTLNSKSAKITEYIARKISFNYIPAVRTHQQTLNVIEELLSHELSSLEENPEYQSALQTINELQQPVLDELSDRIKTPLSEFLPNIQDVKIRISEDMRNVRYRRDFDVEIDDGTLTSIEHKGDGVQSLAALGLLKNKFHRTDASIIAIEEPESHLHPGAIHQLQEIIEALESENQIVLTTHNPLFVNRHSIASNIIVDSGKALQAKSIKNIREILGVKVSDNLIHARYSLVVEGADDKKSLEALLSSMSSKISNALKKNILVIDYLGGAGNLAYKLSTLKSQLCIYHVFLDNDQAANEQRERAYKDDLLSIKNVTHTICKGMTESEFEDCIDRNLYGDAIMHNFGVDIHVGEFRANKKWSERIKACFQSQGKPFDKKIKQKVKDVVSDCIVNNPGGALCQHKRSSIDSLSKAIEDLIG